MSDRPRIEVIGLDEFRRSLGRLDDELPEVMHSALLDVADLVVDDAQGIPTLTGRAKRSVKITDTKTEVTVTAGGAKAPHFSWLNWGGRSRRPGRPPDRPIIKNGRYLKSEWFTDHNRYEELLTERLIDAVKDAGMEVD